MQSNQPTPFHSGKVRDSYAIDSVSQLVVASDRISVFDVVLNELVPGKGKVLNTLTTFWLTQLLRDIPNHFLTTDMVNGIPAELKSIPDLQGRGMVVHRANMLPLECIVRGYLYGSVMDEYEKHQTATGIPLPKGLLKASELPEPIFTPSTKATVGHDRNINLDEAKQILKDAGFNPNLADVVARRSIEIYKRARAYARKRGILVADTKLEFGMIDDVLTLCDEVLTPDSSRFWNAYSWQPGEEPVSFDKQYVRNYYLEIKWDKRPPAPPLPPDIIAGTQSKYIQAHKALVRSGHFL